MFINLSMVFQLFITVGKELQHYKPIRNQHSFTASCVGMQVGTGRYGPLIICHFQARCWANCSGQSDKIGPGFTQTLDKSKIVSLCCLLWEGIQANDLDQPKRISVHAVEKLYIIFSVTDTDSFPHISFRIEILKSGSSLSFLRWEKYFKWLPQISL